MAEDEKNNTVNEEAAPYGSEKKMSEIFPGIHMSSLEEQDEQRRQYSASLTPVERMAYLHQLILIAYADLIAKAKDKPGEKKIIIEELKW